MKSKTFFFLNLACHYDWCEIWSSRSSVAEDTVPWAQLDQDHDRHYDARNVSIYAPVDTAQHPEGIKSSPPLSCKQEVNIQRRKSAIVSHFVKWWQIFAHSCCSFLGRKRSDMRETSLQVRITRKALWGESNNVASNKFGQAVVAIRTKWCSCFLGLCHLHSDWTRQEKLRSPRNNITPEYSFARQKKYEDMGVQSSGFLKLLTVYS